jgi:uncharacterized protein YcgL (UPF0745 family)
MCADIYRTDRSNIFLLVPQGANLETLPPEAVGGLGQLLFMKTRDLNDPLLSVDTTAINAELDRQGFSVHQV